MKPKLTGRTSLYRFVRHHWQLAHYQPKKNGPPLDELLDRGRLTRRQFVQTGSLLAAGGLLAAHGFPLRRQDAPRIAVVGGGIAGLSAAYTLQKAGLRATVYEAAPRLGGRIFTMRDALGPGLNTELGGEFIDSIHEDLLGLVEEFGLELVDRDAPDELALEPQAFFFDGQHYTPAQVIEAFRPIAEQIEADYARLEEEDEAALEFDQISIAQYFDQLGISGWLRELLDVAFVTENGLAVEEQSALNFLWLKPTILSDTEISMYNESDERYSVQGGNSRVIDELAARLDGQLETSRRLEALRERSDGGFTLTFDGTDVEADVVIMTLPFTVLRQLDLQVELPDLQRQAINELGYGTNAKVLVGFDQRYWRELGYSGEVYTDEDFQLSWDNSVQQEGEAGGITFYSGGPQGVAVGEGSPEEQAARFMAGFEKVFPGVSAYQNGKVVRMHWPSYDLTLGSYSCPTVGQYAFYETIAEPVGRLYFAGEHTSDEFWGYMNGGAQSGRVAAERLIEDL